MYFADHQAIGQRIRVVRKGLDEASMPWLEIVGVVPTMGQRGRDVDPIVYLPLQAEPPAAATLIVQRAAGSSPPRNPGELAGQSCKRQ
jgi:hypothetical protein